MSIATLRLSACQIPTQMMLAALQLTYSEAAAMRNPEVRITRHECDQRQCQVEYEFNNEKRQWSFQIRPEVDFNVYYFDKLVYQRKFYFRADFEPQVLAVRQTSSPLEAPSFQLQMDDQLYYTFMDTPICAEILGGYCQRINEAVVAKMNPIVFKSPIQVSCVGCRVYTITLPADEFKVNESLNIFMRFLVLFLVIVLLEVASLAGVSCIGAPRSKGKKAK